MEDIGADSQQRSHSGLCILADGLGVGLDLKISDLTSEYGCSLCQWPKDNFSVFVKAVSNLHKNAKVTIKSLVYS